MTKCPECGQDSHQTAPPMEGEGIGYPKSYWCDWCQLRFTNKEAGEE